MIFACFQGLATSFSDLVSEDPMYTQTLLGGLYYTYNKLQTLHYAIKCKIVQPHIRSKTFGCILLHCIAYCSVCSLLEVTYSLPISV